MRHDLEQQPNYYHRDEDGESENPSDGSIASMPKPLKQTIGLCILNILFDAFPGFFTGQIIV